MTYDELLDATKKLLKHRKRLTYGALKRQFDIDDGCLEELKTEIIQDPRYVVDEGGKRLVWNGGSGTTGGLLNSQRK